MNIDVENSPNHYLKYLYFSRFIVQSIWAALALTVFKSSDFLPIMIACYPMLDVLFTLIEVKAQDSGLRTSQGITILIGLCTTLVIAALQQKAVLILDLFGTWAILAGLMQAATGIQRRHLLGGQWAMILSGSQSTLAGIAFIVGGNAGKYHIEDLPRYAIFGALYFLFSTLRLWLAKPKNFSLNS